MSYFKSADSIKNLIQNLQQEYNSAKNSNDLHSNVIDPFSALLEASFNGTDYNNWLVTESSRQVQKTLQNLIGTFHEQIIGEIQGCENLPVGNVIDIISEDKKLVAEIKNKFNTTKGNHKVAIYDDIATVLGNKPDDFVGYYVEIIPSKPIPYNKAFRPSDNTITIGEKKRPENSQIKVIDGKSFYALITGQENAIYEIYDEISQALISLGCPVSNDFKELLIKAYGSPNN